MQTYNVKDIAEMLDANKETVRRWIRSGKLKANKTSNKDGNVVTEEDLYKFLKDKSKYAAIAAGLAEANPFLGIAGIIGAAGVMGAAASLFNSKNKNKEELRFVADDVRRTLENNIQASQKLIKEKRRTIEQIQNEIEKEEQNIKEYTFALQHLELSEKVSDEDVEGE